jgi:hypothetical protein
VSYVTRRPVSYLPEVVVQSLTLPRDRRDDRDRECVLHADRHYPTVKVFLYLNENVVENGAFVFSPGSHRMTRTRLRHEYEMSVREALWRRGRKGDIPSSLVERNRNAPGPEIRSAFPERSMTGRKNTLVIVNVGGLHRRGVMQPGTNRRAIRMIFHYVYAPAMTQWMLSLLGKSPGRYLLN